MTNVLEHIDSYFQGALSPDEKRKFEQAILADPELAKEVAFYVSSVSMLKEGARSSLFDVIPDLSAYELQLKKSKFRDLYEQDKNKDAGAADLQDNVRPIGLFGQGNFSKTGIGEMVEDDDAETAVRAHGQNSGVSLVPVRSIWSKWGMVAAACVATLIVISIFWFNSANSHMELADNFIKSELSIVGVSMSTVSDSISLAKDKYNAADFGGALTIFERLVNSRDTDSKLTELAGLAALRAGSYEKAIRYFAELSSVQDHISNPGNFYTAVTLMKQNKPGNEAKAKQLLEQVVANDLAYSQNAREWLRNW